MNAKRQKASSHRQKARFGNRAVFLDRDGVINRPLVRDGLPFSPTTIEEFEILPGVKKSCERLKELGFLLVITTNQPDVGRGLIPRESIERIHGHLAKALPVDRVMACYHAGEAYGDKCDCRKPLPGMLVRAANDLGIDLALSFMIGDRWRDVDCGFNAGCRTIFIDWSYAERLNIQPDFRAMDLADATKIIIRLEQKAHAET